MDLSLRGKIKGEPLKVEPPASADQIFKQYATLMVEKTKAGLGKAVDSFYEESQDPLVRSFTLPSGRKLQINPSDFAGMVKALRGSRVFRGGGVKETLTPFRKVERPYKHFDPTFAGKGAGGDIYGKGVYLTDSTDVAENYAKMYERPYIRKHNIPPQAKILDVHAGVSADDLKALIEHRISSDPYADFNLVQEKIARVKHLNKSNRPLTFEEAADVLGLRRQEFHKVAPALGYDGITYNAGQFGRSKKAGSGAKNFVLYNYDVINKPRRFAAEKAYKK
jgi:hypothetical protein